MWYCGKCRAVQATDGSMAHAPCMLDTQGYKCTLTVFNTHCFSTASVVARTRLNVTLYVYCPCVALFCCYVFFLLCCYDLRRVIAHALIVASIDRQGSQMIWLDFSVCCYIFVACWFYVRLTSGMMIVSIETSSRKLQCK